MNHLLVLVDFTETANIALDQAILLAKEYQAEITTCHISNSSSTKERAALLEQLKSYGKRVEDHGLKHIPLLGQGQLFQEVTAIVEEVKADLVVVGTHGIRGIRQNIFGADIYRLVKCIHAPTLVVNAQTKVVSGGFRNVILPVAPHADYLIKVKQTCRILSREGKITIFAILKPGIPLSEEIQKNINSAKKLLNTLNVNWEYQEVNSTIYSVGYAKETLMYSESQGADLISIMTNTSLHNEFFGKMDKQDVLVNDKGVMVLCANC